MQYSHGGRATWAARTDGDKARTRKDFLRTTAIVTKAGVLTFADRLAFPELDGCRTGTYTMRGLDFLPSRILYTKVTPWLRYAGTRQINTAST